MKPNQTKLSIVTVNITGKNDRITNVIEQYNHYDIIGITEAGILKKDITRINGSRKMKQYNKFFYTDPDNNAHVSCVLFIHNRWLCTEEIPFSTRTISVSIKKDQTKEIKVHLIYGPHKGKGEFWEKWVTELDSTLQETIVFGDFNAYADAKLDSSNPHLKNKRSYIRELNDSTGLYDGWRKDNPQTREYTFNREDKASRIDYILLSKQLEKHRNKEETIIHEIDLKLSGDHSAVSTIINIKALWAVERQPEPPSHSPEKLNLKKLKENSYPFLANVGMRLRDTPLNGDTDNQLKELANILYSEGKDLGGTLEQATTPAKKEHKKLESCIINYNRLNRATKSTIHLSTNQPTKAVLKTQINATKYKPQIPVDGNWAKFRQETNKMKTELKKKIDKMEYSIKQQRIQHYTERLRNMEQKDPKKFIQNIKGTRNDVRIERAKREDNTRTGEPEEVKEIVRKKMEALFKEKSTEHNRKPWLETQTIKDKATEIKKVDDTGRTITTGDVLAILKSLNKVKGKATCDNTPLEVFTLTADIVAPILATIFDEIFHSNLLPKCWREGKIHMIFKPGTNASPEDAYDYRPITLLAASYKIYTHILNDRLKKIHDRFLSVNQGGFRTAKSCHHKLVSYKSLIENAIRNKNKLHVVYVDLKKAYDNVPMNEVAHTLEAYGYNDTFVNAIRTLGTEIQSRVITAHGLTEPFDMNCGLRQGCPLSPLLFIIFLDPLLLQMNGAEAGYTLKNGYKISNMAYADDLILIGISNDEAQELLNLGNDFFNAYQLEINVKGKDKTVYTHNEDGDYSLEYIDFRGNQVVIPFLSSHEHYPYLGIWISLTLDWSKQTEMLRKSMWRHIDLIKDRAITTEQKITMTNMLLIPHMAYRMTVATIDAKKIREWNRTIGKVINNSMGLVNWLAGWNTLYLDQEQGGLGLISLEDTQIINIVAGTLSFGANGTDELAQETTIDRLTSIKSNNIKKELETALNSAGLNLTDPLSKFSADSLQPWVDPHTWEELQKAGITDVNAFYLHGNVVTGKAEFINAAKTEEEKKTRCKLRYDIFEQVTLAIQRNKQNIDIVRRDSVKVKEDDLYYSSKMDSYIIWTDGSYRKEIKNPGTPQEVKIGFAGSGIYSKEESRINLGIRTPGLQNNYHAELFALWLTLRMTKKSVKITVILDCEGVIKSVQNTKIHRDKFARKSMFSPLTVQIREMIEERTGKTTLLHCYSHLDEIGAKAAQSDATEKVKAEYVRKMEAMIARYGSEVKEIILGNDRADELAKTGSNSRENKIIINLPETKVGVTTEDGHVVTAGFRKLIKNQLQKKRIEKLNGEGKIFKGVTKEQIELLNSRDHKLTGLKTFQYKLIHNKLTTSVKLKQRKVRWAPEDTKCTFEGCNQEEDLNHILKCPYNPKIADEQTILDILTRIDPQYGWANREMWYSHPQRQFHAPHEELREKLYKEGKTLGNKCFIPPDIIQMIKKRCGKTAKTTIAELQHAVLTRAKTIWGFRCKIFFEKRAIEKIMRKEEEEQRQLEEEARRHEEEQKKREERQRREQERKEELRDPKLRSRRMRFLRIRQKERINKRPNNTGPGQTQAPALLPPPPPPPPANGGTRGTKRTSSITQDDTPKRRRRNVSTHTNTQGTKRNKPSNDDKRTTKRRKAVTRDEGTEKEITTIIIEDEEEERPTHQEHTDTGIT